MDWREGNFKNKKEESLPGNSSGAIPKSRHNKMSNSNYNSKSKNETPSKFTVSTFNTEICDTMKTYEANTSIFEKQFLKWKPQIKCKIAELKQLADEVHKDQLMFNNNNLFLKQINVGSRQLKTNANDNLDFMASISTLVTDVFGGINSVAQACNVDSNTEKFGEIMEKVAEYTKILFVARSKCCDGYKDVEEIIRRYHADTFGSALNKISKAVDAQEMWSELKNSDNAAIQVAEKVDVFFQQIAKVEVFNEITSTIRNYVDSNPAVLDACESTGKAVYDIYETCCSNSKTNRSDVSRTISLATNQALIRREESEITRLRRLVNDEEGDQAKLESSIREAIRDLEREIKEMEELYELCTSFRSRETYFSCHDDYVSDDEDDYHYKDPQSRYKYL